MIEPRDRFVDSLDGRRLGRQRTAQHDDGDAERAGGGDLAIACRAAAVFGHYDVDSVIEEQHVVFRFAERPARSHIGDVGQRQRRIDRIDAADQIKVLRRIDERGELVAPKRNENAARPISQFADCLADIRRFIPAVATLEKPRRPAERDKSNAGCAGGGGGIGRHNLRIGMRCVDHRADALFDEIMCKPGGAAETAAANRYRERCRRHGSSGEREHNLKIGALGQTRGHAARFGGAAEDKDA